MKIDAFTKLRKNSCFFILKLYGFDYLIGLFIQIWERFQMAFYPENQIESKFSRKYVFSGYATFSKDTN